MHSHGRVNGTECAFARTCDCTHVRMHENGLRGSAGDLAEALTTPFANAQVDLDAVLRVFGDNEIHHVAFAKNLSLDWLRASLGDRIATVVWSALHPPVGAERSNATLASSCNWHAHAHACQLHTGACSPVTCICVRRKPSPPLVWAPNGSCTDVRGAVSRVDCASIALATVRGSDCCGEARTHTARE